MAFQKKPFIGKGQIYIEKVGGTTGLVPIGNCSALELGIEEETKEQQDFTNPGGGLYDSVSRITGVTASMTLHDMTPDNIAMAIRGTVTAVTSAPITDEAHVARPGAILPLKNVPDADVAITVKDQTNTTTYVQGTDYALGNSGILILEGGAIADGDTIHIGYTSKAGHEVDALTVAAATYRIFWDGINEADGAPMPVELFRAKFSPAAALSLIGDEFAELQVEAAVLKDDTKAGVGVSQYAKFRIV